MRSQALFILPDGTGGQKVGAVKGFVERFALAP